MPNKRNLKDYGFLVLKGMGMGAADVVPLILLIESISSS